MRLYSARNTQANLRSPLLQAVGAVVLLGALVLWSLPAARGYSAALGWIPMWWLGMPTAAWAALWSVHRQSSVRRDSGQRPLRQSVTTVVRRRRHFTVAKSESRRAA